MVSDNNKVYNPEDEYNKRINEYHREWQKLEHKTKFISNLRLFVFFGGLGGTVYLFYKGYKDLGIFLILLSTLIFIYLMITHEQVIDEEKACFYLKEVNAISLKRLSREWQSFIESGEEFRDKTHAYTEDLDIFGKGSLFQYINVTNTYTGKQSLKNALSMSLKSTDEIKRRQDAVEELAHALDFRQKLQAEGMAARGALVDPEVLYKWVAEENGFFRKPFIVLLARMLPTITIISGITSFLIGVTPFFVPVILLLIQTVLLAVHSKDAESAFESAYKFRNDVKAYEKILALIEKQQFSSVYLNGLKNKLSNDKGIMANDQINRLSRIIDIISFRYHQLYLVYNILTLWDFQCMIALEKWRVMSGSFLKQWLESAGEVEALSSLAVLKYDHNDWVMPRVTEGRPHFNSRHMGHPLLPETRVCNDVKLDGPGNVLIITGSNMSGKSTLLRTAGINLVLAYAGAPVCASVFQCTIMDMHTSMRVSDNLEENVSSFYAELLRIKMMVSAAEKQASLFFLLDEIFKGTNSADRHTGAKVLINKLSNLGAIGLVSTHDIELGDLESQYGNFKNYHFQEYYRDGKIQFDYRLRPGISTTRNAVYLMRMVGIDIPEE